MIIVKLQGGLGNQLFQYAAARGVSRRNERILADHSFLEKNFESSLNFTARDYGLAVFPFIRLQRLNKPVSKLLKSHHLFFRILRRFFPFSVYRQENTEQIDFTKRPSHIYLDGYFQSEKYFGHIRNHLLTELRFPRMDESNETLKSRITRAKESLSIHIRRGDYVTSPANSEIHGVLPLAYYNAALRRLRRKYPDLTAFVFSDDPQWVRDNLGFAGLELYIVEGNQGADSWKDMALMSCCRHHIIGNSSFSWWAAWLSGDQGETIAPERWYNPEYMNYAISDIVPERWALINHA